MMRLPKATLRRGGYMMTTTLEYHVSFHDIVNGLHHKLSFVAPDELDRALATFTRGTAFAAARDMLRDRGSYWFPEGPDVDQINEQVIECARKLFPELTKKGATK